MNARVVSISLLLCLLLTLLLSGCGQYRVTNTRTGKIHYTKDIDCVGCDAIRIRDEVTDTVVFLKNADVEKISEEEYRSETCCQPHCIIPVLVY